LTTLFVDPVFNPTNIDRRSAVDTSDGPFDI